MPMEGSAKLAAIAAELRAQGNGGLRRELSKGLNTAARPLVPRVKAAAGRQLPQSGGLAARVAAEPVKVSTLTSATGVGVRLKTATHDSYTTDKGFVRHPYWGRWVEGSPSQPIPNARNWWTGTLTNAAPEVAAELNAAMDRVLAKIGATI